MYVINRGDFVKIWVKGIFPKIDLETALNFFPWFREIHKYVENIEGWSIEYVDCLGEALVRIGGEEVAELEYVEDFSGNKYYLVKLAIGKDGLDKVFFKNISSCNVKFSYQDIESVIMLRIPEKEILSIVDPVYYRIKRIDLSLSMLHDIVDIIKYLISKGFKLSGNSSKAFSHILHLTKHPEYMIKLKLVFIDRSLRKSLREILNDFMGEMIKQGVLVEIEEIS